MELIAESSNGKFSSSLAMSLLLLFIVNKDYYVIDEVDLKGFGQLSP